MLQSATTLAPGGGCGCKSLRVVRRTGGAVARLWRCVVRPVEELWHAGVAQPQVRRLVVVVVGACASGPPRTHADAGRRQAWRGRTAGSVVREATPRRCKTAPRGGGGEWARLDITSATTVSVSCPHTQ